MKSFRSFTEAKNHSWKSEGHYTKDGTEWTGPQHAHDGQVMTGEKHTGDSQNLYHFKELSPEVQKKVLKKLDIEEAKKMKGKDPCWDGYQMVGTKKKNGKEVPNCVPEEKEETYSPQKHEWGTDASRKFAKKKTPGELEVKEAKYSVDVEGMPRFYMDGESPGKVKVAIRKLLKKASLIKDVERVNDAKIRKDLRARLSGQSDIEGSEEVDESCGKSHGKKKMKESIKTIKVGADVLESDGQWHYALVKDRTVVATGSKSDMQTMCGEEGGRVWTTTRNVGEIVEELQMDEARNAGRSASGYDIYHKDFTSAVQHAIKQAEKKGYKVDMDDWFNKVSSGPRKPSSGKTNSYNINLLDQSGKPVRNKRLNMQVYNMDNKKYELNMYVEEVEQIDEVSDNTLKSYLNKRFNQAQLRRNSGKEVANINDKDSMRKYKNRLIGARRASNKLVARMNKEEVEQIDEKFTPAQINLLRKEYEKIEKVDPTGPTYKKVKKWIASQDKETLKVIAGAKIKWLSRWASSELGMRKEEVEKIDEAGEYASIMHPVTRIAKKVKKTELAKHVDSGWIHMGPKKNRMTKSLAKTFLHKEEVEQVDEKAVSKSQQRFMGMVHAVKSGKLKAPSKEVADAAKSMSKKDARDYAETKHKGLPEKKD